MNTTNSKRYVDTHFHLLEMKKKKVNTSGFLNKFEVNFISGIDVGIMPSDLPERLKKFQYPAGLKISSGLNPGAVENKNLKEEKNLLVGQLSSIDAIGETGLDWHWNYGSKKEQIDLFSWQLAIAEEHHLPVIIHSRNADDDMLKVLGQAKLSIPLIMHCYSSGPEILDELLSLNCFISFSGNVTYKQAVNIQEALDKTPLNRILMETDSPYLSPVPLRGKLNSPLNIEHTYKYAAERKNISVDELIKHVDTNVKTIFEDK